MDDSSSRSSLRERILNDLRNIVKQIYHESVNNELSPENKTYICTTLIKNLDEVLRHGLKQLQLGYWKPLSLILHPEARQAVEKLRTSDGSECNNLTKGRAWISLSLKDDSIISYIYCLVGSSLEKYYESWSIMRSNDSCNKFLSILSGLDNVIFTFEFEYLNKPPTGCNFGVKMLNEEKKFPLDLNGSKSSINLTESSTSLTSPVDSGVHIQDSASDMEQLLDNKQTDIDFLNGNASEVLLRKHKKDTKRHVSFHEDIIYKSPEKCRKLKWDSENLRYSWSGEEIDSSILKEDFSEKKLDRTEKSSPLKGLDINERGVPEGEEAPSDAECSKQNKSHKSVVVRRFLQSMKKQTKVKQGSKKYSNGWKQGKIDSNLIAEVNDKIKQELSSRPKNPISKNEVRLNEFMVKDMIRNQSIYKTYKLRDYLFIITNANVYLINENLETKRISFRNLVKVLVYPNGHAFLLHESDGESHSFVTGDEERTNEVLGRLELAMRRNQFEPPRFTMLDYEDLAFLKRFLVEKLAVEKREELVYCGAVQVDKENDLLSSMLPNTKRGFLMYKDLRAGDSWVPGDFCLKNGVLYLFEDDSKFPKLAMNIATGCQSCYRTQNLDRPHTFQLSLTDKELEVYSESAQENHFRSRLGGRWFAGIRQKVNKMLSPGGKKCGGCVLEFAAANEFELSEWLQMITHASCGDSCEEAHRDELTRGLLWLTMDSLIITNEFFLPRPSIEIISSAKLRDIAAFRLGDSEKDFFTVIEFICMEAGSTSGDWLLYLHSREELDKLKAKLQRFWKFNLRFPWEHLKEGRLVNRCRKTQENLAHYSWTQLLQ